MTLIGWLIVPIAIFVFLWRPFYLLPLMVFSSLFELCTVFNGAIGEFVFGISVFSFVQILIAIRLFVDTGSQWKKLLPRSSSARSISIPLIGFLGWSILSAFLIPRLFAGTMVVAPRGSTQGFPVLEPLQWSWSNLAQAGYLLLNILVLLYSFRVVTTPRKSRKLASTFQSAVLVVIVAVSIQCISPSFYPYEFLNTNPAEYQGSDQEIYGYHRVTGTFGEPSSGGSFLAAAGIGFLASYLAGRRGILQIIGLIFVVVALLYTTSSTGYATFAIGACCLLFYFRRSTSGAKHAWIPIAAAALSLPLIVLVTLRLKPELFQAFLSVTSGKTETNSFLGRLISDAYGLDIFKETWGIGVGLGSSRSSSLISTLLSCLGIVGAYFLVKTFNRMRKLFPGQSASPSLQLTCWALMGILLAGAIGFPDINRPPLWALVIIVASQLAVHANVVSAASGKQFKNGLSLEESARIAPAS